MKAGATDGSASDQIWWGSADLEVGRPHRWRMGPFTLWVRHLPGEWQVACSGGTESTDRTVERAVTKPDISVDPEATLNRFAIAGGSDSVEIIPRTADRPVVTRPDSPFYIPPGEETVMFVGSPLWVAVETVEPRHSLIDMPLVRPSDTWFGPSTQDGGLCYASKTFCRLRVEDLQYRPHRAVTAVTIKNEASDVLALERLNLPVNQLALYAGSDGRLWTQDVQLERSEGGEYAKQTIENTPPRFVDQPRFLSPARETGDGNVVMRAFSTLFR